MTKKKVEKRRYRDYPTYIKKRFGERVQKLTINAGFTCPNRDGLKGFGGCTYCNNQTFNPAYCQDNRTIKEQIDAGISFFQAKYQAQKYLAYFQAYTNTYDSLESLNRKYQEALSHPQVAGLVIGTRPDCVSAELLEYFAELNKHTYVALEYGIESTNNTTLDFINRGHSYEESVTAIKNTAELGLDVGAHMILGLPGEGTKDIIKHAEQLSTLPLTILKLHQLQIVKGTKMAQQFDQHPEWFHLYTVDEYIHLVVDFLEKLSSEIIIERFISQSPKELLLAPKWGLKNFEFIHKLEKVMRERDSWQGKYVNATNQPQTSI